MEGIHHVVLLPRLMSRSQLVLAARRVTIATSRPARHTACESSPPRT